MEPRRPQSDVGQWGGFAHKQRHFAAEMIAAGEQATHRNRENTPRQGLSFGGRNSGASRSDNSVFAHMAKSDEEIRHREVLASMQQPGGSQHHPPYHPGPFPAQPFPSPYPPVYGGFTAPPAPYYAPPQDQYDSYGFPLPLGRQQHNHAPRPIPQMPPPNPHAHRGGHDYGGNTRQPHGQPPPRLPPPSAPSRPFMPEPRGTFPQLVAEAPQAGLLTFDPHIDPISGRRVPYGRNGQRWNDKPRSEIREFSDGRGGSVRMGGFDIGPNPQYMFDMFAQSEAEKEMRQAKEMRQQLADEIMRENMMGRRGGQPRRRGDGGGRGGRYGNNGRGRMEGGRGGGGYRGNGNRGHRSNRERQPQGPPIKTEDIDVMWNDMTGNNNNDPMEEIDTGLHSLVLKPDVNLSRPVTVEEPEKKEPEPVEPSPPVAASTSTPSKIADLLNVVMNGNEFFDDIVDSKMMTLANDFLRLKSYTISHLDDEHLAILMDDSVHPGVPLERFQTQMTRPVLIDGCAAAYSYEPKTFLPHWDGKTRAAPYHKGRILPMKPLFLTAVHFICNGFKTSILLPAYYEEPKRANKPWCKVDNLVAFNALKELGLIEFVEPQPGVNLYDTIKEKVHEVHGVFFSHPDVRFKYKLGVTDEEGVEEGLLMTGNKDQLKIEKAECNSDERMMTVMFGGPLRELHVSRDFTTYTGLARGLDKTKGEYTMVKESTVMFFTAGDGDEHCPVKKMRQQLRFPDQVRLLLDLCVHFPLPVKMIRSIELLLVLAYRSGVHYEKICEFVQKHAKWLPPRVPSPPVVEEPFVETLVDISEPLITTASDTPPMHSACLLSDPDADITISSDSADETKD